LSGELGDDLKGLYTGAVGTTFFWEKIGKNTTMAQNTTLFCRFLEILKVVEVQNEEMS
jgi:hypothetical protein